MIAAHTQVIQALLDSGARSATKYVSARQVVRATRRLYRADGRQIRKRGPTEIVLHIGAPNYLERDFIKACRKSGEPLPVLNVQLKFPPKKKGK